MSEPFLGEIRMVGFNFAPRGWAFCDGQLLPIAQNQSLFSLLGTTFGGDGRTSFALPDLRGRTPVHRGEDVGFGQRAGVEEQTFQAVGVLATFQVDRGLESSLAQSPVAAGGDGGSGSLPQDTPYLALNFCIAMQGLFPSRD